jgi:hypothetical protein
MIEVIFGIIPVLCSGRNMVQTHLQILIGRIPVMKTTMIGPDPTEMEGVLPEEGVGFPPYTLKNRDSKRGNNASNEIPSIFS